MTSSAQHLLDYIFQIQQNERMSQAEKFRRLEELSKAMDESAKKEITNRLFLAIGGNDPDKTRVVH